MAQFVMTWIFPALCLVAGVLLFKLMVLVAEIQDDNLKERQKRERRE